MFEYKLDNLKIDHITKITDRNKIIYHIYYKNRNRRIATMRTYAEKDNLPMTVVNMLLYGTCKEQYTDTGKIEYFTK